MLHIICVAYERPIALRLLIDSFMLQTSKDWELSIVHDGKPSKAVLDTISLYYEEKRVKWFTSKERYGCYGHPNRKTMLKELKGKKDDFVLITNDDNYYVPKFIEYFMEMAKPDVGFIYCDAVTRVAYEDQITLDYRMLFTKIKSGSIDMGSFIVRLDIAKEVGFNHIFNADGTPCFHADGLYAEECNQRRAERGLRAVYIAKPLFVHN